VELALEAAEDEDNNEFTYTLKHRQRFPGDYVNATRNMLEFINFLQNSDRLLIWSKNN